MGGGQEETPTYRGRTIQTADTKKGDFVETHYGRADSAARASEQQSSSNLSHRRHTIEAVVAGREEWLSPDERVECCKQLREATIFRYCSGFNLDVVCQNAQKKRFEKGEVIMKQNDPQTSMFLLADGQAVRLREIHGVTHHMEIPQRENLIGSMHFMRSDPAFATLKALSDVTVFQFSRERFRRVLAANPTLGEEMIYGLSREIRHYNKLMRTPLLEQQQQKIPILPTSIAAGVESYYRSAMNSLINQSLTGQKPVTYLPNMHIQLPTRVFYINGFKGLRYYLDKNVDKDTASDAVKLGTACLPGVIMTPVSSLLEASTAGHMNSEPIYRRWMRGICPRALREVIFGIGLNQLSDYCEERTPHGLPGPIRNALGSMSAGVMAGYFSHVPHNLSTLKLLTPSVSYLAHFSSLVDKSEERLPAALSSPGLRRAVAGVMAVIAPKGLMVRTAQIVGSFIVLNGTIHFLKDV